MRKDIKLGDKIKEIERKYEPWNKGKKEVYSEETRKKMRGY